jgi:hypothetical protein
VSTDQQTKRITGADGVIFHIRVGVDTGLEPQRITLYIAAGSWVIVSFIVVVQPRLGVIVLPREARVVD